MKRTYKRYTKEMLEPLVKSSYSIIEILKKLNMEDNGGNRTTIKTKMKKFDLDNKHFIGKHHALGKKALNRLDWKDVLVIKRTTSKREDAFRLRRSLIESGREYKCEICRSEPVWMCSELRLHVDHKNGNHSDNRPDNLRFLCPNCHSQTDNFCGSTGMTDVDNINRYGRQQYYKYKDDKKSQKA
jgi:5-methylcytosine-specific restriction endonuclease McrA